MRHVDLGFDLEQFAREMCRRADAAGTEAELPRIGSCVGDELAEGFCRKRRMGVEDVRLGSDQGDRLEILLRVVAEILVQAHIDGEQAAGGQQQRVAVGRRAGDRGPGETAAGAGTVLDHEWLLDELFHLPGEDARHHVAGPTRRKADGQRDRFHRIICRWRNRGHANERGARRNNNRSHRLLHAERAIAPAAPAVSPFRQH